MKKALILLITLIALISKAQIVPDCSKYYFQSTPGALYAMDPAQPQGTPTLVPLPFPSSGILGVAIGPAFGYTSAPNPTFWIYYLGTYWYYNGSVFVNTFHTAYSNPGGSKNYLFDHDASTGNIYIYNGTASPTLLINASTFSNTVPFDIVGDDKDNFYLLRLGTPQSMYVYNASGVQTCSYSISGVPGSNPSGPVGGGGFAIMEDKVIAYTHSSGYIVGTMSGSTITFSSVTNPLGILGHVDYASCPRSTQFSSGISASPHPSITCINPNVILTATAALSPVTYSWTGPAFTGSATNPTIQANSAGIYTCSITYTSCPNKTSISTFAVLTDTNPIIASVVPTPSALSCTSPTAMLSVSQSSASHSFLWAGPGIIGANTTKSITVGAAGIYSLAITNLVSGCAGAASLSLSSGIGPLPLNINSSSNFICLPGPAVSLTVSGASNYTWTPSASLSGSVSNVVSANPGITTSYTVNGVTGVCSGSAVTTISVDTTPVLSISLSNPTICAGNLTAISASGASSYSWNPGALNGASISVNPLATTVYTLTGQNGNCFSIKNETLFVNPNPNLSASASPSALCQGISSTLSVGGAITYTWQPGNLIGTTHTVTPLVSTIYTVSGTNGFGCTASSNVTLNVTPYPVLSISPSSPTFCAGVSSILTASGAASYSWNPGGSNSASIVISPTITTSYTVFGSTNNCPGNASVSITVINTPTVIASSSSPTVCAGNSLTLSSSGANSYTWNPGNFIGSVYSVNALSNTIYSVNGTAINGCLDSKTLSVVVFSVPIVSVGASPATICTGNSSALSASGANSYIWNPGNLSGSVVFVAPTGLTNYTVAGTSSQGCTSFSSIAVNVSSYPSLTAISSSSAICANASATLSVAGASSFTWNPGSLNGTNVTVSPLANTTYTVTGGNIAGCLSTTTVSIVVNANPLISLSSVSNTLCSGNSSTLNVSGANSYTWQPSGLNGNSITVTPLNTTVYTVTGKDAIGCATAATLQLLVYPTPGLVSTTTSSLICKGETATLSASGASSYTWTPGLSTSSSIAVSPVAPTAYIVTGSNGTCIATTALVILVNPSPTLFASAAYTNMCSGTSNTLFANGAQNYIWHPGSINSQLIIVNPSVNTTYTVTGTNASTGCSSTATLFLLVTPGPSLVATSSHTAICVGASATLSATGASSFFWNPSGAATSSVTVNPSSTTIYTVTGTNGSCSNTNTLSLSVNSLPTVTASVSRSIVCLGETVVFTASGASTYTWNGNLTGSIVVVSPTTVPLSSNIVVGSDTNGCVSTGMIFSFAVSECNAVGEFRFVENKIIVYPNPNTGKFTLKLNSFSENTEIEIYTSLGELVLKQKLIDFTQIINLEDKANGMYTLKLREGSEIVTSIKILKE
jgi:hypothetical protein